MLTLLLIVLAIVGLLVVMRREAGAPAALAVFGVLGLVGLLFDAEIIGGLLLLGAAAVAVAGLPALRRKWLTPRLFATFKKVAPKVSATERTALEAGSVSWDGELFSGKPQWEKLLAFKDDGLRDDEKAFLANQCAKAAGMCNAWDIAQERADLPQQLWDYLKKEGFFGMIIPKEYGGLGCNSSSNR